MNAFTYRDSAHTTHRTLCEYSVLREGQTLQRQYEQRINSEKVTKKMQQFLHSALHCHWQHAIMKILCHLQPQNALCMFYGY
jgi:hypothetical protein